MMWERALCAARYILLGISTSASAMEIHFPEPKHGLHFTNAVQVWDEALPLGNGILGALVWGDGHPLRISLDRTDLWDLTLVPEFHSEDYSYAHMRQWHKEGRHADLVRLYEKPYHRPAPTKIPAGRIELVLPGGFKFRDTSLSLAEAMAEMTFENNARVRVFVHAEQPVGMIQLRGAPTRNVAVRLVPPPFAGRVEHAAQGGIGAGDLAQLGYPAPTITTGETWQAFVQTGAQGFHFTACLAWRERAGTWEAAWSVASSFEGSDPLGRARTRVANALREGFDTLAGSHRGWWRRYWSQSSVTLPRPILERQWFLDQYKFGAASRRGAPPITLQGPWTADNGQLPPWKGDYHHDLNTQLSYWPCYSGNHLEEGLSYLDWLWATRSNCVAWTRRFFGLPGLNVPMTADLQNHQIGGWRQYTHSATTAAWLAQHFYLHWKYSADREFLRDRAWPYLREASVFIEAITAQKDERGHRTLPLSSSPEIHDNRPEAWFKEMTNYDLALMRWLLGATAELAEELKLSEAAGHWRRVLSEMPEFSLGKDGGLLVAPGEPLRQSHRHFSHLMAIYPLGLLDVTDGPEARRIIEASLGHLDRLGTSAWCGYSFAWLAALAARARDGAKAERALEVFATAFTLRNSFHCNGDQSGRGYSNFRYRPFTLEGNFAAAAGLQEMLLQSQRGRLVVFPAIPETWRNAAFTSLRAEGAFLVSAERRDGRTRRIEIVSENGGVCRLLSPFDGAEKRLTLEAGERVVLTE
jgi:alpha-L-fucosidase 2